MLCNIVKNSGDVADVTELMGGFTISGSAKESARAFETTMLRPNINPLLPGVDIALGDTLELVDDNGDMVFRGVIWDIYARDNDTAYDVTCYDMTVYLNKNDCKEPVFTDQTPGAITKAVCKELGLKCGEVVEGDAVTVNGRGQKAYDIIMQAYTKQAEKDGEKYKLVAKGDEICVFKSGKKHPTVLEEMTEPLPGKLLNTGYRQSMDDLVNAIEVVDEDNKDKKKGEEDAKSQEKYGKIQRLLRGDERTRSGALEDAKTEVEVEAFADWEMVTGMSMQLKSSIIAGDFFVIADTHHYIDGVHTVDLTLSTKYEMDTRTEQQKEKEEQGNGMTDEIGEPGDGVATGSWIDPLQGAGVVTQGPHYHGNAIDIGAPVGTPIVASDGGVVSYAGWMGSYGNVVFINHGGGKETRYAHQSRIAVSPGMQVSKGQLIGYVGNTGNSRGAHIHFEILINGYGHYPGPLIGR